MDGNELRDIRKAVRLNQKEFGDLVGAGRVAVSDWERNVNAMPGSVELVARVLEEDPEYLLKMERWRRLRQ
jgi:DNA-binding transcriptional regulator YiaG